LISCSSTPTSRTIRLPRLEATAIQTVGSKGHDGFVLARVVSPV
jgi:hypothetical protein